MGIFELPNYPALTQATYFGGGPFPFPLGWYWVGALVVGSLLTVAWYRWRERGARARTRLGGYLAAGARAGRGDRRPAAACLGAALPAGGHRGMFAWTWLDVFWQRGAFALLSMAVGLGMLAWIGRSRALAVVVAVYTVAVCLVGLAEWRDESPLFRRVRRARCPTGPAARGHLAAGRTRSDAGG